MRRPLLRLMTERGLTPAQLARAAGVSKAAISQILHAKQFPRWTTARRIALALGVPTDAIRWPIEDRTFAPGGSTPREEALP